MRPGIMWSNIRNCNVQIYCNSPKLPNCGNISRLSPLPQILDRIRHGALQNGQTETRAAAAKRERERNVFSLSKWDLSARKIRFVLDILFWKLNSSISHCLLLILGGSLCGTPLNAFPIIESGIILSLSLFRLSRKWDERKNSVRSCRASFELQWRV